MATVLVVTTIIFLLGYFSLMTVIPKGKQNFRYINGHIVLESNYIFDTGADISVLYEKEKCQLALCMTFIPIIPNTDLSGL